MAAPPPALVVTATTTMAKGVSIQRKRSIVTSKILILRRPLRSFLLTNLGGGRNSGSGEAVERSLTILLFMIRIDWHLVQLISVSIPSLGIYLLAQWAHRLDAKLVLEKKADEAKKAKELEPFEAEKKEKESDPELSEVKERLETLEKAVKEIVGEIKKSPSDEKSKNVANNQEKEDPKNRPDNSHAAMGNPPTAEKATPSSDKQHKHQDSEKTGSHQDKKSD